jgi:hypothetical protein
MVAAFEERLSRLATEFERRIEAATTAAATVASTVQSLPPPPPPPLAIAVAGAELPPLSVRSPTSAVARGSTDGSFPSGGSAPITEVVRAIATELELDMSGQTLRRTVEMAAAELELSGLPAGGPRNLRATVAMCAAELGVAWD